MKQLKKLFASFLAVACLLSALSLPVLAEEETETATDVEAVEELAGTEANENPADAEAVDPAGAEEADPAGAEAAEAPAAVAETETKVRLTEFVSNRDDGKVTVNDNAEITLSHKDGGALGGDHFAMLKDGEVYREFVFEADVKLNAGPSAALVFGVKDAGKPGDDWFGANINQNDNNARIFKVPGGSNVLETTDVTGKGLDFGAKIHMRLAVTENGSCSWQVANEGKAPIEGTGKINGWRGGYIGLLTWESSATFSNVTIEGTPVEPEKPGDPGDPGDPANPALVTNLDGLKENAAAENDAYTETSLGLHGAASGKGDQFIFSTINDKNFVYEADVTFLKPWEDGAAALTFRTNSSSGVDKQMYVANLNGSSGETRVFKFNDRSGDGNVVDMGPHGWVERNAENTYHLRVTMIGTHIVYYVNDQLVLNTADYTQYEARYGQDDAYLSGTLGLMTFNTDVVYQNVKYTALTEANSPELKGLSVTSNGGKVDKDISFHEGQYIYITFVSNDTTSIKLNCTQKGAGTITATDETGKVVNIDSLPVTKDFQTYTLTSKMDSGAEVIYRLRVHRCQPDETYYNEEWRGQFHYTVKDGWANDPNGMVFYKGTYHLFYQYYDGTGGDIKWGTMHWAHATSTDLIHWTEHPIELYPDEYGEMFSGCAVVADHATAPDIFAEGEDGIVLFITANGVNGRDAHQRLTVAYSKDGENFEKYEEGKVVLHWKDDVLQEIACRDPKVFRYENKWFLVIAGGPLRIYSSDDLIKWTPESTYGSLWTECPDLYCVPVKDAEGKDTGEVKWVLSRGGRRYKIGDFKQVNGKWSFVPLTQYANPDAADGMKDEVNDGIMNFGHDSYAAMTYYLADAGAENSFAGQKVIEINWMNTWGWSFCNNISGATGNRVFNGIFNLQLELGVKKDGNNYYLTQTPINQYETLRNDADKIELPDAAIASDNKLLEDFSGDSYEIVATIDPKTSTEFGFKVRAGEGEETVIKYDKGDLVIDRSKSGVMVAGEYDANVVRQHAEKNADGTFTFHIYVDRACVEVFNGDYTVAGAMQIFPSAASRGLSVFSNDGSATGDITVYPLDTIWTNKAKVTEPLGISLNKSEVICYANDEIILSSLLTPVEVEQAVTYSVVSGTDVVTLTQEGMKAAVKALKSGTAVIRVTATNKPSLTKDCIVRVAGENNFKTNMKELKPHGGNWMVADVVYIGSHNDNAFLTGDYINSNQFTYEVDTQFTRGVLNFVFQSQGEEPWNGCYALQLNDAGNVRLFDFKGDTTFEIKEGALQKADKYHVAIEVDGQHIIAKVNDVEYINTTITDPDHQYNNGYAALGMWNSEARYENFFVRTKDAPAPALTLTEVADSSSIGPKVKVSNIAEEAASVTVQVAKANNTAPAAIFNLTRASAEAGFNVNAGSVVTVWDGVVAFENGKPVNPPASECITVNG